MSERTYDRLSKVGKKRAKIVRVIEDVVYIIVPFAGGFLAANGVGLLIRLIER